MRSIVRRVKNFRIIKRDRWSVADHAALVIQYNWLHSVRYSRLRCNACEKITNELKFRCYQVLSLEHSAQNEQRLLEFYRDIDTIRKIKSEYSAQLQTTT